MRIKLSIAEIRDTLPIERREEEKDLWGARYILRPSAVYLAWVLIKLGVSCKQTVLIGLIVGLGGCICVAFGSYRIIIAGCLLLLLKVWLDYADGTIARATHTDDREGVYLDRTCDNVVGILIPIAVGISSSMLTWGLLLALLYTWSALLLTEGSYVFGDRESIYRTGEINLWRLIYMAGVNIQSLAPILLLVTALTGSFYIYLYAFTFLTGCEIIAIIIKRLQHARRYKE